MKASTAERVERWATRKWPTRSAWIERDGRGWKVIVHCKRSGETLALTEDAYWKATDADKHEESGE